MTDPNPAPPDHDNNRMGDRIDRQIAENSSAIAELAALSRKNTLAIEALVESIDNLENFQRESQARIEQIWQEIQEILNSLRNRFPGNRREMP